MQLYYHSISADDPEHSFKSFQVTAEKRAAYNDNTLYICPVGTEHYYGELVKASVLNTIIPNPYAPHELRTITEDKDPTAFLEQAMKIAMSRTDELKAQLDKADGFVQAINHKLLEQRRKTISKDTGKEI